MSNVPVTVRKLSEEEVEQLLTLSREECGVVARRSLMILMSHHKSPVSYIASVCGVTCETVVDRIRAYELEGVAGLRDKPRSGRPRKIGEEEIQELLELARQDPRNAVRNIKSALSDKGVEVGKSTVKKVLKKAGLVYKRMRKVEPARDEEKFREAQEELKKLCEQSFKGEVALYFGDESGFSLTPLVSYAWQPVGQTTGITSRPGGRLNVVGFLSVCGKKFVSTIFQDTVDSQVFESCVEQFIDDNCSPERRIVLVLDNASIHKSKRLKEKLTKWKERGLDIFFIPPYSPELNLIEILWKHIKYYWIPLSGYASAAALECALNETLASVGQAPERTLNFKAFCEAA